MSGIEISLEGKIALVTGGGSGIGRAIALLFARAGADVAIVDIVKERVDEVAAEVEALGRKTLAIQADIAFKASCEEMVERTCEALGGIDILSQNAGIGSDAPLHETKQEDWDRILAINLSGYLFGCQAAIPRMIARGGGGILNMSSDSAFDAIPGDGAYGITKSGVERMTAFMANELVGTGIRVNGIAPGYVKTPLTKHVWDVPERLRAAVEDVPLRRLAEPEEIANLALFLASDLGSYMHGHTILIDGGRIAGNPG